MITRNRRTILKGAVAAALSAQPIRSASATAEETRPMVEKPQIFGRTLYGPHHPLAQGETVTLSWLQLEVEEISTRVVPRRRRTLSVMMRKDADVDDLLRVRLEDEARRFCAVEWSVYKGELWKVEQMLRNAGVDGETVKWAIDDLDVAAVGLHVTGANRMLEVGIDAGRALADEAQPSSLFLTGDRTCKTCSGSGGKAQDCATCGGTGLVDEPGPGLMLIVIPDTIPLEEAEPGDVVNAA